MILVHRDKKWGGLWTLGCQDIRAEGSGVDQGNVEKGTEAVTGGPREKSRRVSGSLSLQEQRELVQTVCSEKREKDRAFGTAEEKASSPDNKERKEEGDYPYCIPSKKKRKIGPRKRNIRGKGKAQG